MNRATHSIQYIAPLSRGHIAIRSHVLPVSYIFGIGAILYQGHFATIHGYAQYHPLQYIYLLSIYVYLY